ncbi:MAG: pentapeptide repeat-containing protein [bacterium]
MDKQVARTDVHDFTHFVFPSDFDAEDDLSQGTDGFSVERFSGKAIFAWATFGGNAHFVNTIFENDADFRWATFAGETSFMAASFRGEARFEFCKLTAKGHVSFEWVHGMPPVFAGEADFRRVVLKESCTLTFNKVSLDKCRFLGTDLTRVEFVDVTWPRREVASRWARRFPGFLPDWLRRWVLLTGDTVYDEFVSIDYELIAESCRQIQANLIDNYRYRQAGCFHIGEQEMMRKAKGKVRQYLCPAILYRLVSVYGESYLRPLMWLGLTLFIAPALLLLEGIVLRLPAAGDPPVEVNYDLVGWVGGFFPWFWDYADAFFINLSLVTWNRAAITTHLTEWYQRGLVTIESILLVVLVTFFVLALKRQFKRKSF